MARTAGARRSAPYQEPLAWNAVHGDVLIWIARAWLQPARAPRYEAHSERTIVTRWHLQVPGATHAVQLPRARSSRRRMMYRFWYT